MIDVGTDHFSKLGLYPWGNNNVKKRADGERSFGQDLWIGLVVVADEDPVKNRNNG